MLRREPPTDPWASAWDYAGATLTAQPDTKALPLPVDNINIGIAVHQVRSDVGAVNTSSQGGMYGRRGSNANQAGIILQSSTQCDENHHETPHSRLLPLLCGMAARQVLSK